MKFLPVLMIVLSGALYHVCQKGLPRGQNPFVVLAAAYFVAFLAMLVPAILGRGTSPLPSVSAAVGLGLACVGIELGVLFAYRLGWKMSLLSTCTSVGACVLLALVGFFLFKERLEPRALLGLLLAMVGLGVANLK